MNHYARPDTVERAYADMGLAVLKYPTGDQREAHRLLSNALDLARHVGDTGVVYLLLLGSLLFAVPHNILLRGCAWLKSSGLNPHRIDFEVHR